MINSLTIDDFRVTFLEIQEPLRIKLTFDERKIQHLISAHSELLQRTGGHAEHVRIHELTTQLLTGCAELDMIGGDLDTRLSLGVTDRWLARNGYLLAPATHERVRVFEVLTLAAAQPDQLLGRHHAIIRGWAGRNIVEIGSGSTLAEKSGTQDEQHVLQCFVACPLTGMSRDEIRLLRGLSDVTSSVLGEHGVMTVRPVLYTSREVTSVEITDPQYRSFDERLIAESDIVLVIAAQPSCGLGVVASLAQRYGRHLVFATSMLPVTPMITGLDPAPTVLDLRFLEIELAQHLDAVLPMVDEAASRTRLEMSDIAAELGELRSLLAGRSVHTLDTMCRTGMSRARLLELIHCPELFAGATLREVRELYRLAAG